MGEAMIDLPPLPLPIQDMAFFTRRRKDGVVEIWARARARPWPRPAVAVTDWSETFIIACGCHFEAQCTLDQIRHLRTLTAALMQ